ncbi:MAG: acetyl-CoA decarbonylase/synthase complex subunit gamma [Deltaproteobacteria bacterium]|nr:acetyl-CoA decarbonylase/synthase complex subunit gamma [Deltaproteobacteria bacterium]
MALTGIQILKLLPKTNCGECKFPTCLAFAMALASGKTELDLCPHVADSARSELSDASAPPIRQVSIGVDDYAVKIGGETVLFRHEKTFFNKPGIGVLITDTMDDSEVERRLGALEYFQYERVGVTMKPEIAAIRFTGNKDRFLAISRNASVRPCSVVLMCDDAATMKEALDILRHKKPLIYGARQDNYEAFGALAKEYALPLAVSGNGCDEVASITDKLTAMGLKDLVIDTSKRQVKDAFIDQVAIRRAALVSKFKPLGFPTITFPCDMTGDPMKEIVIASLFVAKYAGIIILGDIAGETIFPLLLQRLNIYTDPQRPMTTKEGIYPINNPDENSPVLVTCNFSLTYFIVSGEIENSRVPSWLCIMDTEGLSVMTAWAAGKFVGDLVGSFIKRSGIQDSIKHRSLIIPGYAATILGDLEEELPGWKILIGPREAAHIPAYLKQLRES